MKTIELHIQITPDGRIILPPLPDMQPGDYDAVLVIQPANREAERGPLHFPVDDLGPWPDNLSLRREDLYDNDGR